MLKLAIFAETILMPGDPLRAQFIAETYLENVKRVCDVRSMYGFTGTYKGKPVSVMGHGMGSHLALFMCMSQSEILGLKTSFVLVAVVLFMMTLN